MSGFMSLFTHEELDKLDMKRVELLKDAIQREIRTNLEIRAILSRQIRPLYEKWTATPETSESARRPSQRGGSRSRRTE
jgi:hypothetical protein